MTETTKIVIISINVGGGMQRHEKIKKMRQAIRENDADFVLVQETKLEAKKANSWARNFHQEYLTNVTCKSRTLIEEEYRQRKKKELMIEGLNEEEAEENINVNKASTNGGLAFLAKKVWADKLLRWQTDTKEQRYAIAHIDFDENTILLIINVYAPAEGPSKSNPFFQRLTKTVTEIKERYKGERKKVEIIIGGVLQFLRRRRQRPPQDGERASEVQRGQRATT